MRCPLPGLIIVILLLALAWPVGAFAQTAAPELPPGVSPIKPTALLPVEFTAELLSVDWTHPRLRVSLQNGLPIGEDLPAAWDRATGPAAAGNRRALWLQLVEPEPKPDGGWRLALPIGSEPGLTDLAGPPFVSVGGVCPWLPGGPAVAAEPEQASPLLDRGTLAGARWLGRVEDIDTIGSMTLRRRCLVSWTDPARGQTRFASVLYQRPGEAQLDRLKPWLKAEARPGEWLAVHSFGEHALAGAGDWVLGGEKESRRAARLGAALRLESVEADDPIDWARQPKVSVRASSFEQAFPPAAVLRGLLWPTPLAPTLWMSRLGSFAPETPWVELDLGGVRPITRVVVVWAEAAGWSARFNPRQGVLKLSADTATDLQTVAELGGPQGPLWVWESKEPRRARRLRLELPEPSAQEGDRRARVAAIQVWGPWEPESN